VGKRRKPRAMYDLRPTLQGDAHDRDEATWDGAIQVLKTKLTPWGVSEAVRRWMRRRVSEGTTLDYRYWLRTRDPIFRKAADHFGITRDHREAGYILPTGHMLDFSGRHEMPDEYTKREDGTWSSKGQDHLARERITDHRDVSDIGTDMESFMKAGAVRFHVGENQVHYHAAKEPTPHQLRRLREVVDHGVHLSLDLEDGKRKVGLRWESPSANNASGVIKRFYRGENFSSGEVVGRPRSLGTSTTEGAPGAYTAGFPSPELHHVRPAEYLNVKGEKRWAITWSGVGLGRNYDSPSDAHESWRAFLPTLRKAHADGAIQSSDHVRNLFHRHDAPHAWGEDDTRPPEGGPLPWRANECRGNGAGMSPVGLLASSYLFLAKAERFLGESLEDSWPKTTGPLSQFHTDVIAKAQAKGAVRLRKGEHEWILHRSTTKSRKGWWRMTAFENGKPWGHREYPDPETAMRHFKHDAAEIVEGAVPLTETMITPYTCPKCGSTDTYWHEAHEDTDMACRQCQHSAEDGTGFIKGETYDDGKPTLDQRKAAEPTALGKFCVALGIEGAAKDRILAGAGLGEGIDHFAPCHAGVLAKTLALCEGSGTRMTQGAFDYACQACGLGAEDKAKLASAYEIVPDPAAGAIEACLHPSALARGGWRPLTAQDLGEGETATAPQGKGDLSKEDQGHLDRMDANKDWPDKAEDGKAFVVLWADGRGVAAFPTKAAVRAWAKKTGKWADITWIRYQDPEYKGKKLREGMLEAGVVVTGDMEGLRQAFDAMHQALNGGEHMPDGRPWDRIRAEEDPDGTKHDLRLVCPGCGNEQTCRCSKPKRVFYSPCPDCWVKAESGSAFSFLARADAFLHG